MLASTKSVPAGESALFVVVVVVAIVIPIVSKEASAIRNRSSEYLLFHKNQWLERLRHIATLSNGDKQAAPDTCTSGFSFCRHPATEGGLPGSQHHRTTESLIIQGPMAHLP
jgi:hypothetical protein